MSFQVGKFRDFTLRERYAVAAMQGLVANPSLVDDLNTTTYLWLAETAFEVADYMLKASHTTEENRE